MSCTSVHSLLESDFGWDSHHAMNFICQSQARLPVVYIVDLCTFLKVYRVLCIPVHTLHLKQKVVSDDVTWHSWGVVGVIHVNHSLKEVFFLPFTPLCAIASPYTFIMGMILFGSPKCYKCFMYVTCWIM